VTVGLTISGLTTGFSKQRCMSGSHYRHIIRAVHFRCAPATGYDAVASHSGSGKKDLLSEIFIGSGSADDTSKEHFEACMTLARLFLELSKDEFTHAFREKTGTSMSVSRFRSDPAKYFKALEALGVTDRIYTRSMKKQLREDLLQLKSEHAI